MLARQTGKRLVLCQQSLMPFWLVTEDGLTSILEVKLIGRESTVGLFLQLHQENSCSTGNDCYMQPQMRILDLSLSNFLDCLLNLELVFQVLVPCGKLSQLQCCIQGSECTRGDSAGCFTCFHWGCCGNQAECQYNGSNGSSMLCWFKMVGSLHLQELPLP